MAMGGRLPITSSKSCFYPEDSGTGFKQGCERDQIHAFSGYTAKMEQRGKLEAGGPARNLGQGSS